MIPNVLEEAISIVNGPRRETYGRPIDNHTRTAQMWSAYLGREVTAHDVCMLNILQKLSRDAHLPKRDNLVDIAGYALNAELVEQDKRSIRAEEIDTSKVFRSLAPKGFPRQRSMDDATPKENAAVGYQPEVTE